jgi:hypothetical protein
VWIAFTLELCGAGLWEIDTLFLLHCSLSYVSCGLGFDGSDDEEGWGSDMVGEKERENVKRSEAMEERRLTHAGYRTARHTHTERKTKRESKRENGAVGYGNRTQSCSREDTQMSENKNETEFKLLSNNLEPTITHCRWTIKITYKDKYIQNPDNAGDGNWKYRSIIHSRKSPSSNEQTETPDIESRSPKRKHKDFWSQSTQCTAIMMFPGRFAATIALQSPPSVETLDIIDSTSQL